MFLFVQYGDTAFIYPIHDLSTLPVRFSCWVFFLSLPNVDNHFSYVFH